MPSRIVFAPQSRVALRHGFNTLAALMETALGPHGRMVAVAGENPRKAPELLRDGATIARRFVGLPDRFASMGALLARHIAWRVEEAVGDGATTAVVIARHLLNEADRYVAAGYDAMTLRRGLDKALTVVLQELATLARPLDKAAQVTALATAVTGDTTLGNYIAEAFDTVGPYGAVDVRSSFARDHSRQYIPGVLWNQGWVSASFATDGGTALLKAPYILLTNRHLERADELLPILEQLRTTSEAARGLVVIANGVAGDALALLVTNKQRGALPTLAIHTPGLGTEKDDILQDLAAMTGGFAFLQENGRPLETATLADLGQADEVQAIRSGFTLIGGKGRPAAMRERSAALRRRLPSAEYGRERERLVERAGKLLGGVALLHVGGATELERDYLKERSKEAVHVVRLGLQQGVVAGGGVAYLQAARALDRLQLPAEEAVVLPILRSALAAPLQAILRNSGYDPAPIMARLQDKPPGAGFDVLRGEIVEMAAHHIVDPLPVLVTALRIGVSGALMALTTETLIHKPRANRDKEVDFNP